MGLESEVQLATSCDCKHGAVVCVNGPCRCAALDEIGDTSSEEERRRYFQAVDLDKSEGLDFEEFMTVSYAYDIVV